MGATAYLSWRPAAAGDAEWMSGKSRTRLAPALTAAPSWMSDRSAQPKTGNKKRIPPAGGGGEPQEPRVGGTGEVRSDDGEQRPGGGGGLQYGRDHWLVSAALNVLGSAGS